MARTLEADFPSEKQAEVSYDLKTNSEIFQKLFGNDEVDLEHKPEVKRIMGIKPEASTYTRLKDRKGDQRGGSEWEPIKILLEGD
jgi:hypothetical protein